MIVDAPPRPPQPDELEAVIREARRRARRRRAVYGLAALLAAGAALAAYFAFGGGGATPTRRPAAGGGAPAASVRERQQIERVAKRATIVESGVIAPGFGWAINGLALWLTANGGKRWRVITPPHVRTIGDAVARVDEIQFVDRRHGWISSSDTIGGLVPADHASLRHMEIERTSDGGRSWQWSIPPGCLERCGGAHISFLDRENGYALTGSAQPRLYRTRDGGAHWTLLARPPFSGAIVFLTLRNGFGVSDPIRGGGTLYRTHDSGKAWQVVRLAAPKQYAGQPETADRPRFFGRRDGVISVRFRDRSTRAQHVVVYTTTDGGNSWTAHLAPASADVRAYSWAFPGATPFSGVGAKAWVLLVGPRLYRTTNAGRSWQLIRPRYAPAPRRISNVNFTSLSDGWAIFAVGNGAALVQTTDGGRDWRAFAPPMPKPRPFKVQPACGSSCRRP